MSIARPIAAALAAFAVAATAGANEPRWTSVVESLEGYYDIDAVNIELGEVDGQVRMWHRLRYFEIQSEEFGVQFDTEVVWEEYDCTTDRRRILSLTGYLYDKRIYTIIATPEVGGTFERPDSGSIGANLTTIACKYLERMEKPIEDLDSLPEAGALQPSQ